MAVAGRPPRTGQGVGGAFGRCERLAADLGGHVVVGPRGPVVVVERSTALPARLEGLRGLPDPPRPGSPILCLDTETTGLGTAAGTVPFTIGLGAWEGSDFRVRQLVLADHADEPALLALLAEEVPPDACLVTYNGRTFDWPLLVARFRLLGHPPPPLGQHLDLLPLARQIWKHRLPDARLASVEAGVAGVRRPHDLPSAFIPARYLHYLRSGHGSLLREVLEHNRQDVLSLALLLRSLAEDLLPMAGTLGATPMALVSSVEPSDLHGLGRVLSRRRRHTEALACFEVAMEALVTPWDAGLYEAVAAERARTLTRLGRRAEAEGAWHAIALEGGRLAALAWVQVAKHREHDGGDIVAALEATRRARAIADRARLFGRRDRLVERDLARRVTRLRRRLGTTSRAAEA